MHLFGYVMHGVVGMRADFIKKEIVSFGSGGFVGKPHNGD